MQCRTLHPHARGSQVLWIWAQSCAVAPLGLCCVERLLLPRSADLWLGNSRGVPGPLFFAGALCCYSAHGCRAEQGSIGGMAAKGNNACMAACHAHAFRASERLAGTRSMPAVFSGVQSIYICLQHGSPQGRQNPSLALEREGYVFKEQNYMYV